jgi:WD40 repeat protein
MELQRTLEGHGGCVNTVSFDPSGSLLVSGSDDQRIIIWDWEAGEGSSKGPFGLEGR